MTGPAIGQPHLFQPPPPVTLTLQDRFLVPPFSVLDARAGYWQARKRDWLRLGIRGELGRSDDLHENGLWSSDADQRQRHQGSAYPRGARARELALLEGELSVSGEPLLDSSRGRADRLIGKATPRKGYGGDYSKGENAWGGSGTSVFDPVLCELAYRWFSPHNGLVYDPFAGGSVRGVVAAALERRYYGTDLSGAQIGANRAQAEQIGATLQWPHQPVWACADARVALQAGTWQHAPAPLTPESADLVFTCPPYYDLEVYSDDPRDLSAMGSYDEFRAAYAECIRVAAEVLAPDRFAVIVVGEVRDKRSGGYIGLVRDTIAVCEAAGLTYYNEGILVTSVGSLPIRTSLQFGPGRKLGKTHQNVLGFVKGSWRKACEACDLPEEVAVEYGGATWRADGTLRVEQTGETVDLGATEVPW